MLVWCHNKSLDEVCGDFVSSSNELELSWDPLDASYRTMDMASRSLHPNQPTFNCSDPTSTTQDSYDAVKEGFVSDSCGVGGGERERALSPVCCVEVCGVVCAGVGSGAGEVVGVVREEGQEQSDVPDLHLQPGTVYIIYVSKSS